MSESSDRMSGICLTDVICRYFGVQVTLTVPGWLSVEQCLTTLNFLFTGTYARDNCTYVGRVWRLSGDSRPLGPDEVFEGAPDPPSVTSSPPRPEEVAFRPEDTILPPPQKGMPRKP